MSLLTYQLTYKTINSHPMTTIQNQEIQIDNSMSDNSQQFIIFTRQPSSRNDTKQSSLNNSNLESNKQQESQLYSDQFYEDGEYQNDNDNSMDDKFYITKDSTDKHDYYAEQDSSQRIEDSGNQYGDNSNIIMKTVSNQSGGIYNNNGKKRRKVRTTITKDKLKRMNDIFSEYTKQREEGKSPNINLKEIGNTLQLGYSTILHKYRQFRSAKVVKGGALIASLQKKRKYKKSLHIQQTIQQALTKQPFYTAVQLSQYIFREKNKKFSRSIISRHLGEMGYSYKNIKISPIQKNKPKYKQNRKIYASIMLPFVRDNTLLVYLDEFALSVSAFLKKKNTCINYDKYQNSQNDYISVIAGATVEGILHYQVKRGFYTRPQFCSNILKCFEGVRCLRYLNRYSEYSQRSYLITDLNKIHLDPQGESEDKLISKTLHQVRTNRLFLPPASPQLNPLDGVFTNLKNRLHKKDIRGCEQLQQMIEWHMNEISKQPTQVYFKDVITYYIQYYLLSYLRKRVRILQWPSLGNVSFNVFIYFAKIKLIKMKIVMQLLLITIFIICKATAEFPPYVWLFWETGFSTLPQNMRVLNNTRWQIKQVNSTNLAEYLSEQDLNALQQFFIDKTSIQSKSDFVRLALIARHGGVYLDITGYLVEDLNWLDNVSSNPHEMYRIQQEVQFFAFTGIGYNRQNLLVSRRDIMNRAWLETSFLAAKPNSTLGRGWLNSLIKMGKSYRDRNEQYDYFIVFWALQSLMKQTVYNITTGIDKVNKNLQQAFKLAAINCVNGMYFFGFYEQFSSKQQVVLKYKQTQLKQNFNFQRRYYTKQNHYDSKFLHPFFSNNRAGEEKFNRELYLIYYQFQRFFSYFQSLKCLGQLYIIQQSITYNTFIVPNNFSTERIVKRQELPLICRYNFSIQQLLCKLLFFIIPPVVLSLLLGITYAVMRINFSIKKEKTTLNLSQIQQNDFNDLSKKDIEMTKISTQNAIFRATQIEAIVFILLIGFDIIQKVLFLRVIWCLYALIVLVIDIIVLVILIQYSKKRIDFNKMAIFNMIILVSSMIWLHFQRGIPKQMVDNNQFHKNTVLYISLYQNFIALYSIYGYTFFKILVTAWAYKCIRSLKSDYSNLKKMSEIQLRQQN